MICTYCTLKLCLQVYTKCTFKWCLQHVFFWSPLWTISHLSQMYFKIMPTRLSVILGRAAGNFFLIKIPQKKYCYFPYSSLYKNVLLNDVCCNMYFLMAFMNNMSSVTVSQMYFKIMSASQSVVGLVQYPTPDLDHSIVFKSIQKHTFK